MRRTQIYLDQEQDERLSRRARAEGVTRSWLIRRAIDVYLEAPEEGSGRVQRFRAAVEAAAGTAGRLPPGREYVEGIRGADVRRQRGLDRRRG